MRPLPMRSLIACLLLCFAALPALAGEQLRLLIWINGDKGYNGLQKVGDAFTRVTGVKVLVEHPEAATDKFQQSAAAGKGPDIFCWAHDRTGEWAKAGLIVPVRPTKRILSEIDDTAWQAFRYQNQYWGYPLAIEANGLIYNKALIAAPPTSFDDVIKLDKTLSAQGKKAILWHYSKSFFSWPLLSGAGAFVFARNDKGDFDPMQVGVDTAGAIAATELIRQMVDGKHMPRGTRYDEMESRFNSGDIAMMINGPWAWDNARRSKIDFGVAAIPSVNGKPSRPFVGVLGCMIAAPSKAKDIAREFIEQHLLKVESLMLINDDVPLGVPANKKFYEALSNNPLIRATMQNARVGEPIPNIPEMGRFWTAMDAALEAVGNGLQSPADALHAAAARMKAR